MKKNLRYYLLMAALMVVVSVNAQKHGPKFPVYMPEHRTAGAIMCTKNVTQYEPYRPTVYSPFGGDSPTGPKRINHTDGDGGYGGEISDDGYWWDEGEGEWIAFQVGDTKIVDGDVYMWNGSSWEKVNNQKDPDGPIGAMPWVMMVMMAAGYAFGKKVARTESQIH